MGTKKLTDVEKIALKDVSLNEIKVKSTKIHPKSEQLFEFAQQGATKYLGAEFKLSKDLAEANFYAFPSFKSFPITSCFLIYNFSLFLLDDHLEKFSNDTKEWIQYFKNKYFPGNTYLHKWWRCFMKVGEEAMGEEALDELVDLTIDFLSKVSEANKVRSRRMIPTDNEFFDLRCIECGGPTQFFFIRIDAELKLADDLKNDPNWIQLNKNAVKHMLIINDLYSLRKEVKEDLYRCNYVYIKMMNAKISAQEAVDEIILQLTNYEKMAHNHGEVLKKRNDPKLARYVDGLYEGMSGNHYWSTICKRYNQL